MKLTRVRMVGMADTPLFDYMDRVALQKDPRLVVGYFRDDPVDDETLARIAERWDVEALAPSITNVYRQANGFCLWWVASHDPDFERRWKSRGGEWARHLSGYSGARIGRPPSHRHPTVSDIDWIHQTEAVGVIWLVPIEQAFQKSGSPYINDDQIAAVPAGERQLYGRTWKGAALERALRVFELGSYYYPVAFLMEKGVADPPVLLGNDYGASWEESRMTDFEDYMEMLLAGRGTPSARRDALLSPRTTTSADWIEPRGRAQREHDVFDLEAHLPPSRELKTAEDGSTYEIEVLEVAPASRVEQRGLLIASEHWFLFDSLVPLLGLEHTEGMSRADVGVAIAEGPPPPRRLAGGEDRQAARRAQDDQEGAEAEAVPRRAERRCPPTCARSRPRRSGNKRPAVSWWTRPSRTRISSPARPFDRTWSPTDLRPIAITPTSASLDDPPKRHSASCSSAFATSA